MRKNVVYLVSVNVDHRMVVFDLLFSALSGKSISYIRTKETDRISEYAVNHFAFGELGRLLIKKAGRCVSVIEFQEAKPLTEAGAYYAYIDILLKIPTSPQEAFGCMKKERVKEIKDLTTAMDLVLSEYSFSPDL